MSLRRVLLGILWAVWAISWMGAAFWSSRASARVDFSQEASYRLVQILGFAGLFLPLMLRSTPAIKWPDAVAFGFDVLAVVGFAFCWWARLHLGTLWSATVTRKEEHRVIDTGPYAYVRHPIYTGLLVACLATAFLEAGIVSTLGLVVVVAGFYMKARIEEMFLREGLGTEIYDAYAARVPMLVPFWPTKNRAA